MSMKLMALALLLAALPVVSGCQPEPRPEPEVEPAALLEAPPADAEPAGTHEYPAPRTDEQLLRDARQRDVDAVVRTGERTVSFWRRRLAPCPPVDPPAPPPPEPPGCYTTGPRGLDIGSGAARFDAARFDLEGPWAGRTIEAAWAARRRGLIGELALDQAGRARALLRARLVALGPPRRRVTDHDGEHPRRSLGIAFPVDLVVWDGRSGRLLARVTWEQGESAFLKRPPRADRGWEAQAEVIARQLEAKVLDDALRDALAEVEARFGRPRRGD